MGWGKRTSLIAVIACATTALTACGPSTTKAAVGMTVDAKGNPVIVLQNCHADIIQLELLASSDPTVQVLYANQQPTQTIVEIPLLTGSAEWGAEQPAPKLRPDVEYTVHAWAKGREFAGRRTKFTLADLKPLKPGQVRHDWRPSDQPPSYGASPGTSQYRVTTLDDFTLDECP